MIYKVDSVGFVTVDLDRGDLLQSISLLVVSVCSLLWNIAHGSAQLTLTSWLERDSKDEELVSSVVFSISLSPVRSVLNVFVFTLGQRHTMNLPNLFE